MTGKISRFVSLFVLGGLAYNLIELAWRGYTHWSMFFLGGTCFHLIGKIGGKLWGKGLLAVGVACSFAVTAAEFASGCLLNLRLKLNVWDYSHMIGNLKGQVCLLYSALWGALSIVTVPVYRRCSLILSRGSNR